MFSTCGNGLLVGEAAFHDRMPVTVALGRLVGWLVTGVLAMQATLTAHGINTVRRHNPQAPCRPVLHVSGALTWKQRRMIRQIIGDRGWHVRFAPKSARRTDVRVTIQPGSAPAGSGWPLPVNAAALESDDQFVCLARRDEIQRRHLLTGSLQHLF